jgi:hypothetical protein
VNAHDNNVASLVEFSTTAEIREVWRLIDESLRTRAKSVLEVNSKTVDGRTTAGIVLSSPEEKHAYIAACRDAIAIKEGSAGTSHDRIQNDFSDGRVWV